MQLLFTFKRAFFYLLLLTVTIAPALTSHSADVRLPSLGDSTSAVISQQQEYELGRAWLRMYRSRVAMHNDAELLHYLEQLTFRLARHSQLNDFRLELLLINNRTLNAFAVPGGVIGVHTGLFGYALSEDQLASVLAHEIAHLSQRHFARRVDEQRKSSKLTMAGLLASLILAATVGGDAGIAAMTATQAASLENSLRYSRQNEQEADRFGMDTIEAAGLDPAAVPGMFEQMLQATRYTGHKPPEFLLSHPLTEKRVADARNRANQYRARRYPDNPEYYLMRARAFLAMDNNPAQSIKRFQSELDGQSLSEPASLYGLALAQTAAAQYDEARSTLNQLLNQEPDNLHFQMADITLDRETGKFTAAIGKANRLMPTYSDYYPLLFTQAENYLKANRYGESEAILEQLSKDRPEDPNVWFQLAEVRGLAGNISGVHRARAEYFILIGVFDQAREQLGYAARLARQDHKQSAIISQRLRDLKELEDKYEKL